MTTSDLGGRLAFLERHVGTRKSDETLNLKSHIEALIDRHELSIGQYRHEAASKSALLEKRIKGLERLVVFLAEVLIALIAVLFAGLVAGYLGGAYWLPSSGLAAFAFLVTFLGANLLFCKLTISCLK
jgi:hypothetical protein